MQNFTRLFEIPYYQQANHPQNDMLASKINGKWVKHSTAEVIEIVNQLSLGLLKYGIKKGDTVAIVSPNRPEWNFIDLALLQIGAIDVPIYPTISPKEYAYIFNNAEIKLCFVADEDLLAKINEIKDQVPTLGETYSFDKISGCGHWTDIQEMGKGSSFDEIKAISDSIDPEETATMIYTSGTTGEPKGVVLSHRNLVENIKSVQNVLPLKSEYRALSFLPLCHVFERMVAYTYMTFGTSIYYAESMETIGENLKEVKPHFFSTVPRLLEKVYDKIVAKGHEQTGIKKKIFFWALELGHDFDFNKGAIYKAKLAIARKLIFSKWQEALGGNMVGICTGAAALQARLERVFNAAGIAVRQGYGLTETSPVLTFNRFEENDACIGTVGMAAPGIEVKIDASNPNFPDGEGEILAKGPNIMMGYYKKPEETAKVIDADGWFHTGDVGRWEKGKYLKITDRIKQLFKTSGGKYVAPQPIENKFVESPLIEQIMVTGNDQKFVGALIVPNEENLRIFCDDCGLSSQSMEEMICHEGVLKEFDKIRDEFNVNFSKIEKIKRYKLLPNEWTIDGGELTPTMKVKRNVVMKKYAADIADIYDV